MNNDKEKEYYKKKSENQKKREELEKKYGTSFHNSKDSNLPPDIEGQWLENIEKFEEQFNNCKTTTVWEYVGKPEFELLNELEPSEISSELERLMDIMNKNNVCLDTLKDVDDKELYRFITEELFKEETDDMQIEGMMTNFIYEEFHPNAELDIEQAYDYFLTALINKHEDVSGNGYDFLYLDHKNYVAPKNKKINEKIVIKKITDFMDSFDFFNLISKEIKNISINKAQTSAQLEFYIHYEGKYENSSEAITFKGKGTFSLKPSEYGGWDIYCIDMPGVMIQ